MFRVTKVLPALLMLVPLTGLTAQTNSGLLGLVGEKVRLRVAIESDGASWKPLGIEGRVVAVQNDSIQIFEGGEHLWSVPVSKVQSLDVKRGRDRVRGAAIWALGGAVLGVVASTVPPDCNNGYGYDCHTDGSAPSTAEYWVNNIVGTALMGAITGAAIGVDRWERIMAAPQVRVRPVAVAGGLGLKVSF